MATRTRDQGATAEADKSRSRIGAFRIKETRWTLVGGRQSLAFTAVVYAARHGPNRWRRGAFTPAFSLWYSFFLDMYLTGEYVISDCSIDAPSC